MRRKENGGRLQTLGPFVEGVGVLLYTNICVCVCVTVLGLQTLSHNDTSVCCGVCVLFGGGGGRLVYM